MANVTIDGIQVSVPDGSTILQAAQVAGVHVPTLCYHPDQAIKANCRICVCEVEGQRLLQAACSQPVYDGMVIKTHSPKVIEARKTILELILAHHPQDCLGCIRNQNCELQALAEEYAIRDNPFEQMVRGLPKDTSTPSIVRDPDKCVLCRRCISACSVTQTVNALGIENRGNHAMVVPSLGKDLIESPCVMCGQCIHACPVGAISEKEQIDEFLAAVADPDKIVVTQIAPAVRTAIGEEVGMATGEMPMEVFVAGLRQIGFDYVLHTNFTADLTIMEEGNELLKRLKEGGKLPMFTSCSPGWINFCETFYPDLLEHLSTCKSPQQMFGALVKTYWAQKMGIDPSKIYSVSIMPCTAKKFEASRPEMKDSGYRDVDLVLTTREVGRLFRMAGIDFKTLTPSKFDSWMGAYTGAAVIFGATGGVMEAALRTVYEVVTGKTLEDVNFTFARGMEGIKEAEIDLDGTKVKVAIGHGLANARKLMDQVRAGQSPYHFIEIMACPGGCIGGGGQPLTKTNAKRAERIDSIYVEDESLPIRKSHENPEVKILYEEFLHEPLGHKSHELLHTHYHPKNKKFL
ncbi:MAG TPA: 4Fe-4S binding protein [Syntrophothermus lipocalidus]|uniref:Hydrogenase, Fe-only n=1 Tax=Syntrophothermus lipocalidus (strain DSM 12680 / TGB-C1) TaxID=643648 RepID=D7CIR0_SYNLT|nr:MULTISPECIES: NADH-dependent [FeFe] hydrogenase, group A6 [Syntrophothermus]ADI00925.1 hydrogenase, Fe-only [Syntrophothermus lipocalidus DSM 12680]NSW82952.1 iron hydrogenase small subunit [Syntrophothermus sp.]HHV77255.1 4Fe-4S binding protein [Syntrophothermus lipocalidus]